jgi:Spy/CpxP family protein refolding chaperone
MKNLIIILIIAFSSISTTICAQNPDKKSHNGREKKMEKIKTLKIAHISNELNLTTEEAEKFWPIYNEHERSMMKIRHELRTKSKLRPDNAEKLSDDKANELIESILSMKTAELTFQKELISNLKGVIPSIKILKLEHAERTFREMLIKELRDRRPEKRKK